jgi:hypothetical protein
MFLDSWYHEPPMPDSQIDPAYFAALEESGVLVAPHPPLPGPLPTAPREPQQFSWEVEFRGVCIKHVFAKYGYIRRFVVIPSASLRALLQQPRTTEVEAFTYDRGRYSDVKELSTARALKELRLLHDKVKDSRTASIPSKRAPAKARVPEGVAQSTSIAPTTARKQIDIRGYLLFAGRSPEHRNAYIVELQSELETICLDDPGLEMAMQFAVSQHAIRPTDYVEVKSDAAALGGISIRKVRTDSTQVARRNERSGSNRS